MFMITVQCAVQQPSILFTYTNMHTLRGRGIIENLLSLQGNRERLSEEHV